MGVRRNRKPTAPEVVNGWRLDRRPNSFAEAYQWELVAINAEGYSTQVRGFFSRSAAIAYAEGHVAPTSRDASRPYRALVRRDGTEQELKL
jgi:hypothetical protein